MTIFEWAVKHGVSQGAVSELLAIMDPGRPTGTPGFKETSEAAIQANVQIEAARRGGALWRNNSGACIDSEGRLVRYGLGNISKKVCDVFKSADLVGITPKLIGHNDVGTVIGQFTACEAKRPGWRGAKSKHETAQANFLGVVRAMGGIGVFAQSTGDVFT